VQQVPKVLLVLRAQLVQQVHKVPRVLLEQPVPPAQLAHQAHKVLQV
jgi:hypothetical protein